MSKSIHKRFGSLYSLFFATIAILVFYSEILFSPNDFLFSASGDGLKAYYSLIYHLKHDTDAFHFGGMNYPYGDLITFTDSNPILLSVITFLSTLFPSLANKSIGIYNLSMLLSIPLAALFISLILNRFGVKGLVNGLCAIAIVLLSPQIMRLNGHYNLSYPWLIPAAIFFFLKSQDDNGAWVGALGIGLTVLIGVFIHPYLGIISAALIACAVVISALLFLKKRSPWSRTLLPLIATLSPIVIYMLVMGAIDQVEDRSPRPFGLYEYHSDPGAVFLPHNGPMRKVFGAMADTLGMEYPYQVWEGISYVGLVSLVFLLILIYRTIRRRVVFASPQQKALFLSSVILLIFSFCIPFRWGGIFYTLGDSLDIISQFRALGRFTWPFFYVVTLSSLVFIGSRKSIPSRFSSLLLVIAAIVMIGESWATHQSMSSRLKNDPSVLLNSDLLPSGFDTEDFQAIISLPHFLVGAEYHITSADEQMVQASFALAYETGLPLMSSMMSRSSVDQTLKQIQLYEPNLFQKEIWRDMDPNKAILLLVDNAKCNPWEKRIISRANAIREKSGYTLYRLEFADLTRDERPLILKSKQEAWDCGDYMLSDSLCGAIRFCSYEEVSGTSIDDKGGISASKQENLVLMEFDAVDSLPAGPYEFSFWSKGDRIRSAGLLVVEERLGEKVIWKQIKGLLRFEASRGDWHLMRLDFEVIKGGQYRVFVYGSPQFDDVGQYDRGLLRPTSVDVHQEMNRSHWWNNLPLSVDR